MRLIDADALIEFIKSCWDWGSVDGITAKTVLKQTISDIRNSTPIVDAVPVIRCRYCEHSYYASNRIHNEQCWVCAKIGIDVTPDWYCADGERRDNDE